MSAPAQPQPGTLLLLFVASDSPNSRAAITNVQRAMALLGRSMDDVTIVNVFEQPELASANTILVTPTLLRRDNPRMRILGDLSLKTQLTDFLRLT